MTWKDPYINLLKELISIPATSREEAGRADFLEQFARNKAWNVRRIHNNLLISSPGSSMQTDLLLNSHIDTVAPVAGWESDPYATVVENGKIFGLGSNDAGASVVSLLAAFDRLCIDHRAEGITLLLSAEEEISGKNGLSSILPELGKPRFALVGEPTGMQPAVAERGLMVIDALAEGESGHAARQEGTNAIYQAMDDIQRIRSLRFDQHSQWLDPPSVSVTMIAAGTNHNVVPDRCSFVMDVRTTDVYTNEFLLDLLREDCNSELVPRSMRLRASGLPEDHPAFGIIERMGFEPFGSSTLSDMALMPFPAIKIGPGDSSRSHTANEFILESEITQAIDTYVSLIVELFTVVR